MVTLSIPFTDADRLALAEHVRAEWDDVAEKQGLDPRRVTAHASASGLLYLDGDTGSEPGRYAALAALALRLADHPWYYAIEEKGGTWRIVGWAAVMGCAGCGAAAPPNDWRECKCGRWAMARIRLRDIFLANPLDERLAPANAAQLAAREAQCGGSGPGTQSKGQMAAGRARGVGR